MKAAQSVEFRVRILLATGVALAVATLGSIAAVAMRQQSAHIDELHQAIVDAMAAQIDRELTQLYSVLQEVASAARQPLIDGTAVSRATLRRPFVQTRLVDAVFIAAPDGTVLALDGALAPPPPPVLSAVLVDAFDHGTATSHRLDGSKPQVVSCLAIVDLRSVRRGAACGSLELGGTRAAAFFALLRDDTDLPAALLDTTGAVLAGRHDTPNADWRHASGRAPLENAPWAVVLPHHSAMASPLALAVVAVVGLAGVLGVLAWGTGRSVRVPLEELTSHAERLTAGDLSQAVPIRGQDEIGRLGAAFERMRQSLNRSIGDLAESNTRLEERVLERTAALAAANTELERRDRQRARLLHQLITAQEDERRRLARELHDDTCQSLAALSLRLDMAIASTPDDAINPEVLEARALAGRTLDDTHRLIHDLRPSALDELGLVSALQRVMERHLAPIGVVGRIETDAWPSRLPTAVETTLFRAAQEAIVNVARHGGAEHVLVQCSSDDKMLRIEVEDDGCGFDPASIGSDEGETARGLGLLGMRERMASLDGFVTIDSAPERGTRIVLEAPRSTGGA